MPLKYCVKIYHKFSRVTHTFLDVSTCFVPSATRHSRSCVSGSTRRRMTGRFGYCGRRSSPPAARQALPLPACPPRGEPPPHTQAASPRPNSRGPQAHRGPATSGHPPGARGENQATLPAHLVLRRRVRDHRQGNTCRKASRVPGLPSLRGKTLSFLLLVCLSLSHSLSCSGSTLQSLYICMSLYFYLYLSHFPFISFKKLMNT